MGGKVDGRESGSTDSAVRVGLSVHSGHVPAGPMRSVSDTAIHTTSTTTSTTTPHSRFIIVVTEPVCTLQACSHCCVCHLLHNRNGFGRCMKTAKTPWPDCRCAGKCPAGRCGQSECTSNHVVVDLTSSEFVSDSQSTTALPATRSQRQQSDDNHHPTGLSVVSHSSTPSSPLSGVRREAGGVHDGEEVCAGPQADTHASSSAAYRQPSATVLDSRSAASKAVRGVDGRDMTTHTAGNGGSTVTRSSPSTEYVPVERQLPSAVLGQLPSLSSEPRRLPVIGDGRCSVASVLLARGVIPDFHNTAEGRLAIDTERQRLGRSLSDKWTEAEWIRRVPFHLRRDRQECGPVGGKQVRRSYSVYAQHLSHGKPTEWLDHAVLYLASAEYDVGVFVIYDAGYTPTTWYCERIGADKARHIVLFHQRGHYECVEYDGQRTFPSEHELVARLARFADAHPEQAPEDDVELQALEAREAVDCALSEVLSTPARPSPVRSAPGKKSTPRGGNRASPTKRALNLVDLTCEASTQMQSSTPNTPATGVRPLPTLLAQVAQHGPLYDRVSFHNQQQWRAANDTLWNAYRLASMTGQRSQLTPILLDILLLPQRVLTRLRRSGKTARHRAAAATARRFRNEGERLRKRYNCPDPDRADEQQMQMSTDTMANTATQPGYSRPSHTESAAARRMSEQQAADTTDAGSDSGSDVEAGETVRATAGSDDEDSDHPYPSLRRQQQHHSADLDHKAAQRAAYLVQCGLTRKAAQVLHSSTQMADLRTADVQQSMLRLHPLLPAESVLPTLPHSTPLSVLEDDAGLRKLLTESDNGASAGPSGWGGNMLAVLARSDICRLGVMALLRDIVNGALPDEARQLLLASRLVALTKPSGDGYRPIAVGELFYRLAAIVAVRRVSSEAARLLSPHQFGIGVPAGGEKIVHSLQHELTDTSKRLAMLQVDIANAFNSCDRARLLCELYALPGLQSVYRIADFAYTQPSALVLSGCDGLMIQSAQGVRQGDPLSALLFCVYMRSVLQSVSDATGVKVYGFFDDISVRGTPEQVMAALSHLQHSLPTASLQLNTAKSHFTYFHDNLTPLTADTLRTLSASNIQLHHEWVGAVGAVVGRDDAAIRVGMRNVLAAAGNYDSFLRRVQLDDMPMHTALSLLRVCLVPAMNYYLRCIAPVCIEDEAQSFDRRVAEAAIDKLGVEGETAGDGQSDGVTVLLQRKLRDGGMALVPAARTSPAAFLGSLATCHTETAFALYCDEAAPVPASSILHGWIDDSMQRVRRAAEGVEYQLDIAADVRHRCCLLQLPLRQRLICHRQTPTIA